MIVSLFRVSGDDVVRGLYFLTTYAKNCRKQKQKSAQKQETYETLMYAKGAYNMYQYCKEMLREIKFKKYKQWKFHQMAHWT